MANNDPVGTIGAKPQEDDLALIYRGGDNFLARMKALSAAKDAHDRSFLELKIGADARSAFTEATAKRDEAEKLRAQAAETLRAAQEHRDQILSSAQKTADSVKAQAADEARDAAASATAMRADADKYAVSKKTAADRAVSAAEAMMAQAKEKALAAEQLAADHEKARQAADAAKTTAENTHAVLSDKINRLHTAIDAIRHE